MQPQSLSPLCAVFHDQDFASQTLGSFLQEIEPVYDLFAVSNHYGGMAGGHYTAYAKLNESGEWYCFDDSHTYPVQAKDVVTPAAYVLFYRRKQETIQDKGTISLTGSWFIQLDLFRANDTAHA